MYFLGHILMMIKYKKGIQKEFSIFENSVIVKAESEKKALKLFKKKGESQEGDSDGTLIFEGRLSEEKFIGIRQIFEIDEEEFMENINYGIEIGYSKLKIEGKENLKKLLKNDDVILNYSNFELEISEEELEKINLKLDKENPNVYYRKGEIYFELEKYQEAIENYTQAINILDTYVGAYLNRGKAYEKLNKNMKAFFSDSALTITLFSKIENSF